MVEIEIGVMAAQCLDRRIPTKAILIKEVKAWERGRNQSGARIKRLFTVERAREKLGRAYWSALKSPFEPRPDSGQNLCVPVLASRARRRARRA